MAKFTIEVRYAHKPPEVLTLQADRLVIGREGGDIALFDPQCSTPHAELVVSGGGVTVSDLESTNGTFTGDGERIFLPTEISPGSELRLGSSTLVVREIDFEVALPEVPDLELPPPRLPSLPARPSVPPPVALALEVATPASAGGASLPTLGRPTGPLPPPSVPPRAVQPAGFDVPPPNMPSPSIGPNLREIPRPNFAAPVQPGHAGGSVGQSYAEIAPKPLAQRPWAAVMVFTWDVVKDYRRVAWEVTCALALWIMPGQLLAGLLSVIPIVGSALQSAMTVLVLLAFFVFGSGVASEAARRAVLGQSVESRELWLVQGRRWVPWFLAAMAPLAVALAFGLLFVLPGIALGGMLLPLLAAEEHQEIGYTRRHLELVCAQPLWSLGPYVLTGVPAIALWVLAQGVVGFIPVVGSVFASLLLGGVLSVGGGGFAYLSYRVYLRVLRQEGVADPEARLSRGMVAAKAQ